MGCGHRPALCPVEGAVGTCASLDALRDARSEAGSSGRTVKGDRENLCAARRNFAIVEQSEHLPIYKRSYDLCVYLEQIVLHHGAALAVMATIPAIR